MSATLYWSRTGKEAGRNADTKRCCARETTFEAIFSLGRKSVIAGKTCEKTERGRRSLCAPYRKSEDLYYSRGAIVYLQR